MQRPIKNKMISMRVTESQFRYLEEMARRIREKTGLRVTRASIILKLMEYGYPYLRQDFPYDGDDNLGRFDLEND